MSGKAGIKFFLFLFFLSVTFENLCQTALDLGGCGRLTENEFNKVFFLKNLGGCVHGRCCR